MVRFRFGVRPPMEEAANPLLSQQASALQQEATMTDMTPPSPPPSLGNHSKPRGLSNPDSGWYPDEEPRIWRPSVIQVSHNSASLTNVDHSYPESATSTSCELGNIGGWVNQNDHQEAGVTSELCNVTFENNTQSADHEMEARRRLAGLPQPEYGEPFLTLTSSERDCMDHILAPLRDSLVKLKGTTLESLPDYHCETTAHNHAQILKARLSDIAAYIQRFLCAVPCQSRGLMELKLW
jgi:hypothetical protein